MKQRKRILYSALTIIIVLFILYFGINGLFAAEKVSEIVIPEGTGAGSVITKLYDEGLIKSKLVMKAVIKITGSASKIHSGSAEISSKMSYFEIKDKLLNASSIVKVTIPEGYEIDDIVKIFSKNLGISEQELYREIESGQFDYHFITDELPAGKHRLEGYIFPETYYFEKNMSAHQVIDACLNQFDKVFTDKLQKQTEKMGFTVHEIITLASIIEKEGKTDLDKISSVFHNRLKSDYFSYLESCATVIYVTKQPKDRLTYNDINVDSPYNTYLNKGLPPGPIASPGEQAIVAAVYPAETDYYYFSALDNGKNTFSKTYDEHLAKQE